MISACSSSSSGGSTGSSGTASTGKPPSQTKITINGAAGSDSLFTYMAQQEGYYKAAGLNVTLSDAPSPGSAVLIAGLVGGSFQFLESTAAQAVTTAQAAGSVKAVMTTDIGQQQIIIMPKSLATSYGVSLTAATPADSLDQLGKLRGSHLTVGLTTATSQIYSDVVAVCKTHGLTCAVNSKSADIDIEPLGTNQNVAAGFKSGRVQAVAGIASGELSTLESTSTTFINLGNITPVSGATGLYLITTANEIKNHPDTVQAVVTATTKAWDQARKDPATAKAYFTKFSAIQAVTDPTVVANSFAALGAYWRTPLLIPTAYTNVVNIINLSGSSKKPITLGFSDFAEPTYAQNAVKSLGLTDVPTTP